MMHIAKSEQLKEDDSASRFASKQNISLKLIELLIHLVPVCGPGSWVIVKFSYFTQIEDLRKKSTHGEYIDKIQEPSHGRIFKFLLHLDKNGKKRNSDDVCDRTVVEMHALINLVFCLISPSAYFTNHSIYQNVYVYK